MGTINNPKPGYVYTMNQRIISIFSLLILSGFIGTAYPSNPSPGISPSLNSFTSTYKIKKGSITIGESQRTLTINNDRNVFESVTRPAGFGRLLVSGQVVERSEWRYKDGRIQPVHYTYFDSSGDNDRNVQITFDWINHRITNTINGEPWKMKLLPDTQDKLIYQVRLMLDLLQGKSTLDYPVADGGKLKYYKLDIIGEERIKTEFGEYDTIRLRRVHGKRKTTFWCVKNLKYLPIRIEQRLENNSPITAILTSLSGTP